MRVLAIDTALEACSAAVLDTNSGIAASETVAMTRGHAEAVTPLIARVMSAAAIEFVDLDRIAVTTGPGSFTGLRVGISAARGIALAAAADGEELTRQCFGDRVAWVPWRRPGFQLGLDIAAIAAASPQAIGVILGGHGITAWGATSAECEARSLEIIRTAAEFIEAGASASDDRRLVFQQMIERACDGEHSFDLIVVHSYSRFFREAFEQEFYLRKLAKHGVRVVSITQPVR